MMRSYLILLFTVAISSISFTGCLTDTITGPEVRARLVYPPGSATFQATNFQPPLTGDMVVRWTRSPSDTQLNFKGYYIRLWSAELKYDSLEPGYNSTLVSLIDSVHVYRISGKLDTSVTFRNIQLGQYTIQILGEKATDTLGYSKDTLIYSNVFDPRPVVNPTNVQATSINEQAVKLHWTLTSQDTNSGLAGYSVYFVDTNPYSGKTDSAHRAAFVPRGTTDYTVSGLPGNPSTSGTLTLPEHPFKFWVKAVRVDSVINYTDSNSVLWAGAVRLPRNPILDTIGYSGFHNSIYIGNSNATFDMVDDSNRSDAQVVLQLNGSQVTLQAGANASFLDGPGGSGRIDTAGSLDSIYYTTPLSDPTQFNTKSISLDAVPLQASGVVVYLMFKDDLILKGKNEWSRVFIKRQLNGTFVNPSGGVHIEASVQPGEDNSGSTHLPYY